MEHRVASVISGTPRVDNQTAIDKKVMAKVCLIHVEIPAKSRIIVKLIRKAENTT